MSFAIAHMNDEKIWCMSEDSSDTFDTAVRGTRDVVLGLPVAVAELL
jgi:hypothetical protein